ncbi:MAG TPA: response regulator, partial [Anaerolineales bacterium]|nr:response regulator [Anaerolineales bacterium]
PAGKPFHIILITAYAVPGLKEASRQANVNEVLIKPVQPERICQIVEKLTEEWERSQPAIAQKAAPKPKILIADDRPDNVTLLARYLENEGYVWIAASNGEETLALARQHIPDLLLLDVNMPNKDGFDVVTEIRADPLLKHIPVILLTAARLDPVDIHSGLNLGADDYITKPFDRRELMARIRTKLRVKGEADDLRRRNRELSLLLEITGILNARSNLDGMLNDMLQLLVSRLSASAGYVLNFENGIDYCFPTSAAKIDSLRIKEYLDRTPRENRAYLIEDVQKEAFWKTELGKTTRSAAVAMMLNRHSGMLGVILLTHNDAAYFRADQIPILQAIANQTAVTIENTQWYATLQRRTSIT